MQVIYPVTTFNITISYPSVAYPNPIYTTGTTTEQTNGWAFFTANALLALPDWSNGAGLPGIIALHGGNQTALTTATGADTSRWGDYTRALADGGFAVLAVDHGAQTGSNNLALYATDLAYTYLTGITGNSMVGVMGSSDGAGIALNWARRHRSVVAGVFGFSSFLDLDSVRATAGWTVPYSIQPGDPNAGITYPTPPDATRTASINSAYKVTTEASYTANVIIQGNSPARNPELWRGMRIKLVHSVMDATAPYQQTVWWVSAVADPRVTVRLVTASTADHEPYTMLAGGADDAATIAAGGFPRAELRDFFREIL